MIHSVHLGIECFRGLHRDLTTHNYTIKIMSKKIMSKVSSNMALNIFCLLVMNYWITFQIGGSNMMFLYNIWCSQNSILQESNFELCQIFFRKGIDHFYKNWKSVLIKSQVIFYPNSQLSRFRSKPDWERTGKGSGWQDRRRKRC